MSAPLSPTRHQGSNAWAPEPQTAGRDAVVDVLEAPPGTSIAPTPVTAADREDDASDQARLPQAFDNTRTSTGVDAGAHGAHEILDMNRRKRIDDENANRAPSAARKYYRQSSARRRKDPASSVELGAAVDALHACSIRTEEEDEEHGGTSSTSDTSSAQIPPESAGGMARRRHPSGTLVHPSTRRSAGCGIVLRRPYSSTTTAVEHRRLRPGNFPHETGRALMTDGRRQRPASSQPHSSFQIGQSPDDGDEDDRAHHDLRQRRAANQRQMARSVSHHHRESIAPSDGEDGVLCSKWYTIRKEWSMERNAFIVVAKPDHFRRVSSYCGGDDEEIRRRVDTSVGGDAAVGGMRDDRGGRALKEEVHTEIARPMQSHNDDNGEAGRSRGRGTPSTQARHARDRRDGPTRAGSTRTRMDRARNASARSSTKTANSPSPHCRPFSAPVKNHKQGSDERVAWSDMPLASRVLQTYNYDGIGRSRKLDAPWRRHHLVRLKSAVR